MWQLDRERESEGRIKYNYVFQLKQNVSCQVDALPVHVLHGHKVSLGKKEEGDPVLGGKKRHPPKDPPHVGVALKPRPFPISNNNDPRGNLLCNKRSWRKAGIVLRWSATIRNLNLSKEKWGGSGEDKPLFAGDPPQKKQMIKLLLLSELLRRDSRLWILGFWSMGLWPQTKPVLQLTRDMVAYLEGVAYALHQGNTCGKSYLTRQGPQYGVKNHI